MNTVLTSPPEPENQNKLGRILAYGVAPIGGVVILFLALIALINAFKPQPQRNDDPDKGMAVFATRAEMRDVELAISAQGEARPRREINLAPQVAGRITYISPNFIDGGFFEEGEVLLRIDPTDYEYAVTRSEGQVAQARSALQREQAEAELARRDWEELGQGPASALTLREPQLAEARAQLAAAEASLDDARLALSRTEIAAPFTGRVRRKGADLGQYVSPSGAGSLGEIYATDIIEVRLPLTDSELAQMNLPIAFTAETPEEGAPVTLHGRVLGLERTWNGSIMRTDSVIDARTRVIFATAEVQDPFGAGADEFGVPLPVGLFVRADIAGRTIEDGIVLPRDALNGADTVYVANLDGTLTVRTVNVVNTDRTSMVINAGVADGEYVVTSRILAPQECMRIRVFDRSSALLFPVEKPEEDEAGTEGEASDDASGDDVSDDGSGDVSGDDAASDAPRTGPTLATLPADVQARIDSGEPLSACEPLESAQEGGEDADSGERDDAAMVSAGDDETLEANLTVNTDDETSSATSSGGTSRQENNAEGGDGQ